MSSNDSPLFQLLPAIYRIRDAAQGGQLQNLLAIFQDVLDSLDHDIQGLYENWFIETCAEWVVPYIGDLVQSRPLYSASPDTFSARAYVAHTLSYRRRKGTPIVLEQLATDVTGWPAHAVEFFQLLATTQYLNHLRPQNVSTPDLRHTDALELLSSPFGTASHTADVRGIVDMPLDPALSPELQDFARLRGRCNIANIGLFLWRLAGYPITQSIPRPLTDGSDGRYLFHPLGIDEPLFNQPQSLPDFSQLSTESTLPVALRRRALYDELESRRQTLVDQQQVWLPNASFALGAEIVDSNGNTERANVAGKSGASPPVWPSNVNEEVSDGTITWQVAAEGFDTGSPQYFGANPVLEVFLPAAFRPVPPEQIMICDLGDLASPAPPHTWRQPPASKTYVRASDGAAIQLPIAVSVDPVLGRLAFPSVSIPANPAGLQVSFSYAFSGDLGGGPYNRAASVSALLNDVTPWQVAVSQELVAKPGLIFPDLKSAVAAWNQQPAGSFGVIAILDSHTYPENLIGPDQISIPDGSTLLMVAADWPSLHLANSSASTVLSANAVRPHIRGLLGVQGSAADTSTTPGTLILHGLLIEGAVNVAPGNLGSLQLLHSTVISPGGGPGISSAGSPENVNLNVTLERSICGPIQLSAEAPGLNITDSIIDGGTAVAINAPGADASLQSTTVFGSVGTAQASGIRTLQAGNSIFTGLVNVERVQAGCVRFCFAPTASRVPQRYRCQPDLAVASVTDPAVRAQIIAELTPLFTSTHYGDPGYAQLSYNYSTGIRAGADNGSEMGAFYFLKQPQRDTNLRTALPEYLRFGLQAGIFYVT